MYRDCVSGDIWIRNNFGITTDLATVDIIGIDADNVLEVKCLRLSEFGRSMYLVNEGWLRIVPAFFGILNYLLSGY